MKFIKTKGEDEIHITNGVYWRRVTLFLWGIKLYSLREEFNSATGEWENNKILDFD